MTTEMNVTTFAAFAVSIALSIWGRSLREKAFGELSASETSRVADKVPNYTSTELIPFAALLLALVGVILFRLTWLKAAYSVILPLLVLLVTVLHVRTRRRFRSSDLPPTFLSRYEHSRIVTYSALVVPLALFAWLVYR